MTLIANPCPLEAEKEDNVVAKLELVQSGNGNAVAKLGTATRTFLTVEIAGPETGHTVNLSMNGPPRENRIIHHGTLAVLMVEPFQLAPFLGLKLVQMVDNGLSVIQTHAQTEVNGPTVSQLNNVLLGASGLIVNVQMVKANGHIARPNSVHMVDNGLTAQFSNVRMVGNGHIVNLTQTNVPMVVCGRTATVHLEEVSFLTVTTSSAQTEDNGPLVSQTISSAYTVVYGRTATVHLEEVSFPTATISNVQMVVDGLIALDRIGQVLPPTLPITVQEARNSQQRHQRGSQAT
jgi:hypothetical protein